MSDNVGHHSKHILLVCGDEQQVSQNVFCGDVLLLARNSVFCGGGDEILLHLPNDDVHDQRQQKKIIMLKAIPK
jgi:hypothetical protein